MSARSCARLWESVMPAELCLWRPGRVGEQQANRVGGDDGGTLPVPADLPRMTSRRVQEPAVALLRVARGREGMASAVER